MIQFPHEDIWGFLPDIQSSRDFRLTMDAADPARIRCGKPPVQRIAAGVPRIPRSLLSQRLNELEDADVVDRRMDARGKRPEYHLTTAGQELFRIVMALGEWGPRWANQDIGPEDLDPGLLMWDMRGRINLDNLPQQRGTIQFDFQGVRQQSFWLMLERSEPSVCISTPGLRSTLSSRQIRWRYARCGWATPRCKKHLGTSSSPWRGHEHSQRRSLVGSR